MVTAVSVGEVHVKVTYVPRRFLWFNVGTKIVRFTSSELVGKTIDEAQRMVAEKIGHSVVNPVFNDKWLSLSARETTILQADDELRLEDP